MQPFFDTGFDTVLCPYSIVLGAVNAVDIEHLVEKEDASDARQAILEIVAHSIGKLHPFDLGIVCKEWSSCRTKAEDHSGVLVKRSASKCQAELADYRTDMHFSVSTAS